MCRTALRLRATCVRRIASSGAAGHALVQRLFTADANVRNVKTFFSVHRAKFAPAVTLPALAG